jgi:short-subunit dehydrogenase
MKESEETPSRVCVVVGVGEGLGAALSRRFANRYKVALIARSPGVITRTADEIRAGGGIALRCRAMRRGSSRWRRRTNR